MATKKQASHGPINPHEVILQGPRGFDNDSFQGYAIASMIQAEAARKGLREVSFTFGENISIPVVKQALTAITPSPDFEHSDSYRSIKIRGQNLKLTTNQGARIKVLHEVFLKNPNAALSQDDIRTLTKCHVENVWDCFRRNKEALALLVRTVGKGMYQLNL